MQPFMWELFHADQIMWHFLRETKVQQIMSSQLPCHGVAKKGYKINLCHQVFIFISFMNPLIATCLFQVVCLRGHLSRAEVYWFQLEYLQFYSYSWLNFYKNHPAIPNPVVRVHWNRTMVKAIPTLHRSNELNVCWISAGFELCLG